MTKQEKIREEIIDKGLVALCAGQGSAVYYNIADRILSYLQSQGVVLKVERELPDIMTTFGGLKQADTYQREMLKAGYVAVEPLIEEEK